MRLSSTARRASRDRCGAVLAMLDELWRVGMDGRRAGVGADGGEREVGRAEGELGALCDGLARRDSRARILWTSCESAQIRQDLARPRCSSLTPPRSSTPPMSRPWLPARACPWPRRACARSGPSAGCRTGGRSQPCAARVARSRTDGNRQGGRGGEGGAHLGEVQERLDVVLVVLLIVILCMRCLLVVRRYERDAGAGAARRTWVRGGAAELWAGRQGAGHPSMAGEAGRVVWLWSGQKARRARGGEQEEDRSELV